MAKAPAALQLYLISPLQSSDFGAGKRFLKKTSRNIPLPTLSSRRASPAPETTWGQCYSLKISGECFTLWQKVAIFVQFL
jgi:hypothetical protein